MPKVIAITSEKGGVGKSTLAIHLAGAFAERGFKVALIDEDDRIGSSSRWACRAKDLDAMGFCVLLASEVKPKKIASLDVIVIDTEGRPKRKELRQLASRADTILIPSGTSALELESAYEFIKYLATLEEAEGKSKVVLTRVQPIGRAGDEAREELRNTGVLVCSTLVRQYAAYQKAAESGVLVSSIQGGKKSAWADILSLSLELL